jgi:AP-4 complex subunit sigma-1
VVNLQIMFNIDKAHFILDEMVTNGFVVETNKANVLRPVMLMDRNSNDSIFKR